MQQPSYDGDEPHDLLLSSAYSQVLGVVKVEYELEH
jgi:hypothetical protein